jgi:ABC-type bacteriocin/lantibiotic exporter with double-glycine peptidase domain
MQGKIEPAARALAELAVGPSAPENLVAALREGLERAVPTDGNVPLAALDWLKLAAESLSVHLELLEASHSEITEWLRWEEPLLTSLETVDDHGARAARWIVVRRSAAGARIAIYGSPQGDQVREVGLSELAGLCGFEGERRLRWLKARPGNLDDAHAPADADGHAAPAPPHPFRRLIQLVAQDRGDVIAVAVFAVAIGVLSLATPIAVQALVNFVALGGAIPPLLVVALLLFLGLSFAAVLSAVQTWVVEVLQRRLFVRVFADLTARLPRLSLSVHEHYYAPELVNRFLDVTAVQKLGAFFLLDGLAILLSASVGLVVLAFYHPLLLAFDVVLLLAIVLIVIGPARRGMKTAKAESNAKYKIIAWLEELARNPLLYKSSGALRFVFEHSDRLGREFLAHRTAHFRVVFTHYIGVYALQVLASTALLGVGGLLVIEGTLSLGQLVAAELIVTLVVSSVAKLGKHVESFYDLMAATDKVGKLLDLPVEHQGGEHHLELAGGRGMGLEFHSVGFGRPGQAIFERISVQVRAGERVGVRGPSGSGKTALLELAWGLRKPSAGAIRIDGRDLRTLALESVRRTASLVESVEVMEGTLRENVRVTRPFITDDDVHRALKALGLLEEIERLPDGLETKLTSGGRPLSSGQLARLQVARAIAGRPRLVLISDFFQSLAPDARARVLDVLFDPQAPWTLVIASNEPAVLARCARVLTLPEGRVETAATATA